MVYKINKSTFSGSSNLFNGSLAGMLIAMAQTQAVLLVNTLTPVTDNSTGAADATGDIVNPGLPTSFTAGTADAVAKTELEASLTSVRRNFRALIRTVNDIVELVPVFPELSEGLGGAAPTSAIEAIDKSMTGTDTAGLAAFTGTRNSVQALTATQQQLVAFVNKLCDAFGVDRLVSEAAVPASPSSSFGSVSVDTGTASTGAATVSKAQVDVILSKFADNIATITAKLNEIVSLTPKADVVVG